MVGIAIVYGLLNGTMEATAKGAFDGAASAVELCLSMAGIICLWTGVMSVMQKSGLAKSLSRLLSPVLGVLFPSARRDTAAMEAISANVSANLLGLGNAATPLGIKAARRLQEINGGGTAACGDLSMLLVLNTASIQLIPATVAALRVSLGASQPFSILPHVWITSVCSLTAALGCMALLRRFRGGAR
jgi:spore maturation protein A